MLKRKHIDDLRIYIGSKFEGPLKANDEQKNQLTKVMRVRDESFVVLTNQSSYLAFYENGFFVPIEKIEDFPSSKSNLTIIQALPHNSKTPFIIQKCVELGVTKIVFFKSRRSISKVEDGDSVAKLIRWNKIAIEAFEQSKSTSFPEVVFASNIEVLKSYKGDTNIICYENEQATSLKSVLPSKGNISVIIGPEGGFEVGEVDAFSKMGFKSVSLGKNILRTETVSIFVASVIKYLLND